MEHLEASWEQKLLAIDETDSMPRWLNNCVVSNELDGNSCSSMASDALFDDLLRSYHSTDGFFDPSSIGSGFFSPNSMNYAREDAMEQYLDEKQMATAPVQFTTCDPFGEDSQLKRKFEKLIELEMDDDLFQIHEEKAWVSSMQRSSKRARKIEENNAAPDGQSTSCHGSENCPTETLKMNNKTRSNGGTLYARRRRERINERLKILQSLVPNGTKVDISTMLEEAVQYVKFLQLQIKLLSSDELWMYAPIAYNGIDIGLDLQKLQQKQ